MIINPNFFTLNNLMTLFGIISLILFLFLSFTSLIIIISLFKTQKFKKSSYKEDAKVSIIVPVYNEEKNISKCLNKIIKSNFSKNNYEVIVVDDGSSDNTINIVKKFKGVKILRVEHKGKTHALNYGISKAKYELVLTIDADTMMHPDAVSKMLEPFSDETVGAVIGTYLVENRKNMLTAFQAIEYSYNSLIRYAFSKVFSDSVWFYGAMSCYRKSALKKIGNIHSDTLTEDMDVSLRLQNKGYKIIHVHDAYSNTIVPETLKDFYKQRIRWWTGVLQSMKKNKQETYKRIFNNSNSKRSPKLHKSSSNKHLTSKIPVVFIYLNQWWWTFFSLICIPMYIIQVLYWLPFNLATFYATFMYLFRWFSIFGPLYSIYMIPEWGINFYSAFGISAGLISVTFIILSLTIFKSKVGIREVVAIMFYFPYTLIMNTIIMVSVIKYVFNKPKGYIK